MSIPPSGPPLTTLIARQSIRHCKSRPFSISCPVRSRLRQPGEPTGPNEPPTHTTSAPSKSPLKVWPILLILATGTFLFKKIVDERKGQGYQPSGPIQGHSPTGKGIPKPSHPH